MLLGMVPAAAFAAEDPERTGLCEHHPAHTAQCGYTPATEGSPCGHEHTEDCYELTEHCTHQHTAECFPQPAEDGEAESPAPETAADSHIMEGAPSMGTGLWACTHQCSVESGCLEQVLNCQHQHDEVCGYAPAVEGTPCTFVCEICRQQEGDEADWPETPDLPAGAPLLEDGQMTGAIYGQPAQKISAQNLALMQSQSQAVAATLDPDKEITEDQLNKTTFIYINGTPYGGGNLEVTEGDNFSYMHTWAPKRDANLVDGSWFRYTMFRVPGLNLRNKINSTFVINGIKVGEYQITYNQSTGEMTYQAVFNRYISFFGYDTILALL